MDSTGSKKKKTNGHVRQSSEITIDLETTTPPWVPPLHQHQESALRSTQPQPAERTVNPREFHFKATVPKDDRTRASRVATRPSAPPTSAATTLPKIDGNRCKKSVVKVATKPPVTQTLCRESARTSPEQFSNKTAAIQQPTPAHDTVYVDQQGRRHVDTDNGNDEVYFKNAHGNSWTGPLIDDEEAHVRDTTKTSLPEQAQRALAEIQTISSPQRGGIWASKHAPTAGKEKEKWRKDMHLQQIIRQVKQIIRKGAKLTLQHHGNNAKTERAETVTCSHPYCPSSDRLVSDGDYYIVIDSTPSESIFCLRCLEGLWNGKDMASSLPDPKVCSAWSARPESMPESHLLDLDGIAEHDADEIDYPEIPYVGDSSHDGAELMEAFDLSCSASDGSSKDASASPWSPVTLTASTPATDVFSVREQLFPVPAERTMLTKRLIASSMGVQASTPAAVPLDEDSDRDEVISPSVSKASRQSSKRGPEGTNNADHGLTLATILRRSNRRQPVAFQEPEGGTGTEIVPSAGKKERVAKTITTDALVEDITRAEKQLKKRYLRRESVLAEMTPGSSSPVHQRTYGGKVAKSMAIRMDDFGIVCTDLLSEPVSYLSQEAQPVRVNPSRKLYRLIATLQGKWLMQQEMEVDADYRQHWCICHGVDDGRIMVLCGNRFCLYGWFHLECLGITDVPTENEEWLCPTCTAVESPRMCDTSLQAATSLSPDELFPQPWTPTHKTGDPYGMASAHTDREHSWSVDALGIVRPVSRLPSQLDGAPEDLNAAHNHNESLNDTSSPRAHTPGGEPAPEILVTDDSGARPTSSPWGTLPETPGSPHSVDSTDSNGAWRQPPTRFQHLAAFIQPSESLTTEEKEALQVWKAASQEQVAWEEHLAEAELIRREVACNTDDEDTPETPTDANRTKRKELEEGEIVEDEGKSRKDLRHDSLVDNSEELELPNVEGLTKKNCRGKDLSLVLAGLRNSER